jgi:hypothetical protein
MLEQLTELAKHNYVPSMCPARIHAALGDTNKAFESLEKSYDERSLGVFPFIKVDSMTPALRPALCRPAPSHAPAAVIQINRRKPSSTWRGLPLLQCSKLRRRYRVW